MRAFFHSLFLLAAISMSAPVAAMPMDKSSDQKQHQPRDCSTLDTHKEACEARNKALAACKDKDGADRRACMSQQRETFIKQPRDCSQAENKQRCEKRNRAVAACKDKSGPEFRTCMQQQRKAKPAK